MEATETAYLPKGPVSTRMLRRPPPVLAPVAAGLRPGGRRPCPDAAPQPLGDGRVPLLGRHRPLRALEPPAAPARLPAHGGPGHALRPGLPQPLREPRGPGRGLLAGGLLGAGGGLPPD